MQLPPQHLAEIVAALRSQSSPGAGAEKRKSTRNPVAAQITITEQTSPGRAFTVLTRDVSVGGLGFIGSIQMQTGQMFGISLARHRGGFVCLQCRVTHARALADGVWAVGARFASFVIAAKPLDQALEQEAARIRQQMLA